MRPSASFTVKPPSPPLLSNQISFSNLKKCSMCLCQNQKTFMQSGEQRGKRCTEEWGALAKKVFFTGFSDSAVIPKWITVDVITAIVVHVTTKSTAWNKKIMAERRGNKKRMQKLSPLNLKNHILDMCHLIMTTKKATYLMHKITQSKTKEVEKKNCAKGSKYAST